MTMISGLVPEETHFSINKRPEGSSASKSHGFRESMFQLQTSTLTDWEMQNSASLSLTKESDTDYEN
jgi:hypothetical protein